MQLIKTTARIDYDEDSEAFTPLKKKKQKLPIICYNFNMNVKCHIAPFVITQIDMSVIFPF